MILNNIYLILLLPLWIFVIIMGGRFFSVYVNKKLLGILTLLSSFIGIIFCGLALCTLPNGQIFENQLPFIKINNFIISCGIYIDKTALIFGLVLFLTAFFVQLFSISYMKSENKTYRFYALLNLFNFAMSGLFFSPNLYQSYFFWEIAGVVSYLLIGFEYFKKEKSIASEKVFIINRIGDTALICSIILCSYFMYEYGASRSLATLSFVDMTTISTLVYAYTSTPLFWIICGLFIIAAAVKSAQFPFYTWLQDAMEAKLPVSALLHSATLVASGVFILLRLTSFFSLESIILKGITIIGLLTALVCSLSACAQTNPKKTLAYSTSAQLGLIFWAIGGANIKAAVAFFIAHAFIKSALFLCLPKESEKWSYINFTLFVISGLSLSGIILSGMATKEMIYLPLGQIGSVIFAIISFLTAFYIIRIALVVADRHGIEKSKLNKTEFFAILGLILANAGFYLFLRKYFTYKVSEPFWAALTAWVCVYVLYIKHAFWKVPVIYPITLNGFYLDKFYTEGVNALYNKFACLMAWIDEKIFANYKPFICGAKAGVITSKFIENNIMNNGVNVVIKISQAFSKFDKKAQTGNIQSYNAYAFIIITIVLTCLIMAYTAIISYIGG